jgi:hypothetical protein
MVEEVDGLFVRLGGLKLYHKFRHGLTWDSLLLGSGRRSILNETHRRSVSSPWHQFP